MVDAFEEELANLKSEMKVNFEIELNQIKVEMGEAFEEEKKELRKMIKDNNNNVAGK